MSFSHHQLLAEDFDMLATGNSGPRVLELLRRSQHSKHILLMHAVAMASPSAVGAAPDLLARAQRKDPAAVTAVVRYPSVGVWAYRTMRALRGGPRLPGASPDQLAAVAAAAAISARIPWQISVPVWAGLVVLPSLGVADIGIADTAKIQITPARTQVSAAGKSVVIPAEHRQAARGWHPVRPVLTTPFEVVVDDLDLFRMPAAPHLARALELTGWRQNFADAWVLLRRHHPMVAVELSSIITMATPLVTPSQGHASSSSPEAFGAVAMSEPTDPIGLAATLTHEIQHAKLSALQYLVPLIRRNSSARYYASWRDDPRPASALLQGAYAYLGMTGFWRRQRRITRPDILADTQFARWRDSVAKACATLLASEQLTESGEHFVRKMSETIRLWRDEPVARGAQRLADAANDHHMARWQQRNGPPPNLV